MVEVEAFGQANPGYSRTRRQLPFKPYTYRLASLPVARLPHFGGNMHWRKIIIYVFTVLLPALIVGISNFSVFPDSSLAATLMLLTAVGVAGAFTYFSGDATPRVARYCILADIAICAVPCVNLG